METPRDLKYSREHEWARIAGDTATIGITDFAQDQLGDIVYLDLPKVGTPLAQFDKIGEIESVKSVVELFTPLGGEVAEVNSAAIDSPELVNQSPYGDGWLIRLRQVDPTETAKLLSPEEYDGITAEAH